MTATGGTGNYSYTVTKAGFSAGPQSQNLFQALPPGNYTVRVQSGSSNANTTTSVADEYDLPNMTLQVGSCGLTANVTNGRPPFTFRRSATGPTGPWSNAQPSPTYLNLAQGQYWIQATDDCGNTIVKSANINGNTSLSVDVAFVPGGVQATGKNGTGKYTFSLISDGVTTTNTTGFFPETLFSCDEMTMRVNDGCDTENKKFTLSLSLNLKCVKFLDGTATLEVTGGKPPFVFEAVGLPNNSTGVFSGLLPNSQEYQFKVTDACGKFRTLNVKRQTLLFDPTPLRCTTDTLTLQVERSCQNFSYAFPTYNLTCPTCTGINTASGTTAQSYMTFTGATPGNITVTSTDACGEVTTCRDSLGLYLFAGCDSISAQLADFFICDGFYSSKRYFTGPNISYKLYGPNGSLVQANSKGIFRNLTTYGTYRVTVTSGVCGDFEAFINLEPALPFNPKWNAALTYSLASTGKCAPAWTVKIDIAEGPYYLTGGPDQLKMQVDDEHVPTDCSDHTLEGMKPGSYVLWSRSRCDSVHVILPEIFDFELKAFVRSDCPGDAVVEARGNRTRNEWRDWFASRGLNNWNPGPYNASYRDHYTIDEAGLVAASPHQGTPYFFTGLDAGPHTVYMYAFGNCPVDTASVVVPEKKKVELKFQPNVICDGENALVARCQISEGKPPYTLQQVDCNDPSVSVRQWTSMDTLIEVSDLPLGLHCFRLVDSCGNSGDYQVAAGYLSDTILPKYTCDGTLELTVDEFPFDYQWFNATGQPIAGATSHTLSIPAPTANTAFSVEVNTGDCLLSRDLTLPYLEITPTITTDPVDAVVCGNTPLSLSALAANAAGFEWSDGSTQPTLQITGSGTFTVTVTNALGCTNSETIEVKLSPPQVATITGPTDLCTGSTIELNAPTGYATYNWSNGQTTPTVTVSVPGNISLEIRDTLGCIWQNSQMVVERPLPKPQITGSEAVCAGLTATLDGGTGYASYVWSNGQTTQKAAVGGGWHYLTVKSDFGCEGIDSFFVEEIPLFTASVSADTTICVGGKARILPVLGAHLPGAQLFWSANGVFYDKSNAAQQDGAIVVSPSESTVFTLDSIQFPGYDCPFSGLPADVKIAVDIVDVKLQRVTNDNGLAISCYGKNDGTLIATLSSGIQPFNYEWNDTALSGQTADNLAPGFYAVTVTDQLGCTGTANITLIEPAPLVPTIFAAAPLCYQVNDGVISIENLTGAQGPAQFSIGGNNAKTAPGEFDALPPGEYLVSVVDALGCEFDTLITFAEPEPYTLEFPDSIVNLALGDNLTLQPKTNYLSPASFTWTPSEGLSDPASLNPDARPARTTTYQLEIITEIGCRLVDAVTVRVDNSLPFFAPTAFAPGSSTGNDYFTLFVKPTATTEIRRLQVFDRWGSLVYSVKNPGVNDAQHAWRGQLPDGKNAPGGIYIWEAEVISILGKSEKLSGDVLLVR